MLARTMIAAPPPPTVAAPTTARIGHQVRVVAENLSPARYSLTIVFDRQVARSTRCLADVGHAHRARDGRVVLTGRIPRRLTCVTGASIIGGTVATAPGAYHFVVGEKLAPGGWEADAGF